MSATLSVRIDVEMKKRLEALARSSKRTKPSFATEAIAACVEAESWQLKETKAGLKELDAGQSLSHEDVSRWLRSWGKKRERKAPRG